MSDDPKAEATAAPVLIKPKTVKVRSLVGAGTRCYRHGLNFEASDVIEAEEKVARSAVEEFPEEFEIVGEEKPKVKPVAPETAAPKN